MGGCGGGVLRMNEVFLFSAVHVKNDGCKVQTWT